MGTIIYRYRAEQPLIDGLQQKYGASLCQEMLPLPDGLRVHLNLLVERTLKKPTNIVVANFKELGEDQINVSNNAHLILKKGHTLRIESKGVEFKTPEEFEEYFKEFLDLMAPVTTTVVGKRGPKPKVTPELVAVIEGLRKRGLSAGKIREELLRTPGVNYVPARETIWQYFPEEDQDLPAPSQQSKSKRKP